MKTAMNDTPRLAPAHVLVVDDDPDLLRLLSMRLRAWDCEKCSDPECEHRLFSALASRGSAPRAGGLTGFRETPEAG